MRKSRVTLSFHKFIKEWLKRESREIERRRKKRKNLEEKKTRGRKLEEESEVLDRDFEDLR